MKILVPDYYKKFHCKCGACRNCCCIGWGVTISYDEYCRLIGLNCTKKLRIKLDCAFFILPDATNERYAKMKPNFYGECPVRDKDGLCALQKECGEDVLPIICKMYPRNSYMNVMNEWACANSCEGVLDILCSNTNKIAFVEVEDDLKKEKDIKIKDANINRQMQLKTIEILEDREMNLNERMLKLGEYIEDIEGIKNDYIIPEDIYQVGLPILIKLISELEDYSPNFSKFSIFVDNDLGIVDGVQKYDIENIKREYLLCLDHFNKVLPNNEFYFEKLMINHLFFERFPYSEYYDTKWEQFVEICGIYKIAKFVAVLYMKDSDDMKDFIDCMSGIFRCFEHSNASEVILHTMKRLGEVTHFSLISLIEI